MGSDLSRVCKLYPKASKVVSFLRMNPGQTLNQIMAGTGCSYREALEATAALRTVGELVPGTSKGVMYWWVRDQEMVIPMTVDPVGFPPRKPEQVE